MPSCQTNPRRARHRLAVVSLLVAAGLWACDGSEESPTASSAIPATAQAKPSAKKSLIAFSSSREVEGTGLYVMTPDGRKQRRITDLEAVWSAWSPDQTQLAFTSPFVGAHIYVVNADGTNLRQLTNDAQYGDQTPDWSPDGSKIAFQRNGEIIIMNADGTNPTVVPHSDQDVDAFPSWSPDGTKLAVARDRGFNQIEQIWVISVDGTQAVQLTSGSFQNTAPEWSPDGTRIAFSTNRDVVAHVYVMNADGTGQTRLTTALASGEASAWSPDGSRIAVASQGDIWVLNADGTGPTQLTTGPARDGAPSWAP